MDPALTLVLAGGTGTRLLPLTCEQAKPAVAFGPGCCLLDLTLLNCLRSGISRVYVLVQYKAASVAERIRSGWRLLERRGEMTLLLRLPIPPQAPYRGTADAVRRNLSLLRGGPEQPVLILSGDHVYHMDYRPFLAYHQECGADLTIGVTPVPVRDAHRFGILTCDGAGRVRSFLEKPKNLAEAGGGTAGGGFVNASMGVYIFRAEVLMEALSVDPAGDIDFGKHVVPKLVESARVFAFPFVGERGLPAYWRDVGTLRAYYEAQMDLVGPTPSFVLRIPPVLRTSRLGTWQWDPAGHSLVALSSSVRGEVRDSVIAPDAVVERGAVVERAVVLEGAVVERGNWIRNAIVARRARVLAKKAGPLPEGISEAVAGNTTALSHLSCVLRPEGEIGEQPPEALKKQAPRPSAREAPSAKGL